MCELGKLKGTNHALQVSGVIPLSATRCHHHKPIFGFRRLIKCVFREEVCVSVYLTLAEGQTGVDVFTVNPLQEAAAPVQHRLLLPCLKVTEQLIVHLHMTAVCISLSEKIQTLDTPLNPPTSLHSRTIGCVADGSGCVPKMADDVLLFLL